MSKVRQAGGIDIQEDIYKLLPGMGSMLNQYDSRDIAHATYVFDVIQAMDPNPKAKAFYGKLAGEYASRFAEWLEFVFLNRANFQHRSKAMKEMTDGIDQWVESIPTTLERKTPTGISSYVPKDSRFLNFDLLDAIGRKILKTVYEDWQRSGTKRTASTLEQLPVVYDNAWGKYLIPGDQMTYQFRRELKDLGFSWAPGRKVWYTDALDSDIMRALPAAGKLQRGGVVPAVETMDVADWFFDSWLPQNIDRFSKVFNGYGRTVGVPYKFKFTVQGRNVTVEFRRDINDVGMAIRELEARYGKDGDRDGWLAAIAAHDSLKGVQGSAAMHAIDVANNLEHTHGAMMEHFPPGVRSWYPKFLDFKYTAHPLAMVNQIQDEDLRTVAKELLPSNMRSDRVVTPRTDYRTPKGLALEISSQPGKAQKLKMLEKAKKEYPKLYPEIVELLKEKLSLKTAASRVASRYLKVKVRGV